MIFTAFRRLLWIRLLQELLGVSRKSRPTSAWLATATRTNPSRHLSYCCYYYYIYTTNNDIYRLPKTSLDSSTPRASRSVPEI